MDLNINCAVGGQIALSLNTPSCFEMLLLWVPPKGPTASLGGLTRLQQGECRHLLQTPARSPFGGLLLLVCFLGGFLLFYVLLQVFEGFSIVARPTKEYPMLRCISLGQPRRCQFHQQRPTRLHHRDLTQTFWMSQRCVLPRDNQERNRISVRESQQTLCMKRLQKRL